MLTALTGRSDPTRYRRRLTLYLLDPLLALFGAAVLFVAFTGGGSFVVGGVPISLRRSGNPLAFGAAIACIRYLWFRQVPFFGGRIRPADFDTFTAFVFARFLTSDRIHRRIPLGLIAIIACSVVLRLINAWAHPGFTTGDDVEIHELTLAPILGTQWDVWNLRNPFYPMTFIYPFQLLTYQFVGADVEWLVFAGRAAVVAIATLSLWLVYRVSLLLTDSPTVALLATGFVAFSRLHLWYASSELPRPVASVFVLASCWLLLKGPLRAHAVTAGLLLGIGGALRFGELVFFAPAILHLIYERRGRDALALSVTGVLSAGLCLGVADWLYRGIPFFSLVNILDYTLVQQASSRGFQPLWYYFASANDWTNIVFLGLGLSTIALPDKRIAIWTWVPIALLSVLPHKEARYVIAVHPFLCIGVALALRKMAMTPTGRIRPPLIVFGVLVAVVFEISNWRFRRTDDAVRLAQRIADSQPSGIAAQQLWRFGGRLYWKNVDGPILELPDRVADVTPLNQQQPQVVIFLREYTTPNSREQFADYGYRYDQDLSTPEYVTLVRK